MNNRTSYMLGMLRSIVRGRDRMCSLGRCCIDKLNIAETI